MSFEFKHRPEKRKLIETKTYSYACMRCQTEINLTNHLGLVLKDTCKCSGQLVLQKNSNQRCLVCNQQTCNTTNCCNARVCFQHAQLANCISCSRLSCCICQFRCLSCSDVICPRCTVSISKIENGIEVSDYYCHKCFELDRNSPEDQPDISDDQPNIHPAHPSAFRLTPHNLQVHTEQCLDVAMNLQVDRHSRMNDKK